MKIALLFPGQGSQAVGMGKALTDVSPAAKAVFAAADDALGEAFSQTIWEGPADELKRTRNTQPAILVASIAALRALEEKGAPAPAFVAGHSLGEYSALVAAGTMPFSDAVKAVRARGTFMQEAVPEGQGAMAAVLGMDADKITEVVRGASTAEAYVDVANYNGPEQTVIAGSVKGVEVATAALKAAGAKRVMALPVSAPFHCKLMAPVQPRLDDVLSRTTFASANMPVVTNVEATPNTDGARTKRLLVDQVTAPVRFTEIVRALLAQGVDTFVEVGPGKVLIGIVKRMKPADGPDLKLLNVEDPASLDATMAVLNAGRSEGMNHG
jgi:[acyl-carrier-protein] S-malonyltransferase